MDWLTHLFLYGSVRLKIDVSNAVPAFTPPPPKEDSCTA